MLLKSYCNVSGLPVALAVGFACAPNLGQFKGKVLHPIFSYPLWALSKAAPKVLKEGTQEEHKLLLCAFAYKLDLWEVREPLTVEASECDRILDFLLDLVPEIIRSPLVKEHNDHVTNKRFPKLSIDSLTTKGQLISHLKVIAECLAGKVIVTQQDKLDWELELEAELNRTLRAGVGYSARMGKWAVQSMRDACIRNKATAQDVEVLTYCLDQPADMLKPEQLSIAIDACLVNLPCNDDLERADSLLVIRHLERKQEILVKEQAAFGLVDLEEVDGAAVNVGAQYKITVAKPTTDPAMVMVTAAHKAQAKAALLAKGISNPSPIQLMLEARNIAKG